MLDAMTCRLLPIAVAVAVVVEVVARIALAAVSIELPGEPSGPLPVRL